MSGSTRSYHENDLKFIVWNIDGFVSKLDNNDFKRDCLKYDIICFVETWTTNTNNDDAINFLPGFKLYHSPGKKPRIGRTSGGVMIYIKNEIIHGVRKLSVPQEECIFLVFDSNFFGFDKDIIFGGIYIPPVTSTRHTALSKTTIDTLEEVLC